MQTVEKKIKVYVSSNGKEFLSEQDCLNYEKNVLGRLEKIKYFIVHHGADFTEGRGFQSHSYVAVESDWNHSEIVMMYCQIKFGNKVDWMYSVPALVWDFAKITEAQFHEGKPKYGKKVFLSHSDIDGLPQFTNLNQKTKKEEL